MKKNFLLILMVFISLLYGKVSRAQEKESGVDFFTKVLNDNGRYGAFLALKVKSKSFTGTVVTENFCLYRYYNETHGWQKNEYVNFLRERLNADDTIRLDDQYIKSGHCFFTSEIKVDSLSANEIVKLYFTPGEISVMRSGITFNDRNRIVRKLFENKVACRTDDETGAVVLVK
ncbi:hypothetical protein A4D02_34245 [Niastella koreensis]|uniref:Uncharacterized protein n=2 Tax=Niastella koreensis TaxID=354356 RepID=G8TDD8_NIAKG|nr:hypothetical protein [Niastella koreensis]AEV99378.1 hypothetical protein Niako_3048 [Niastella koreensis GR20-10]OQP45231.1 hypothetical protein A4D02_34245 [Niastella koreensis]